MGTATLKVLSPKVRLLVWETVRRPKSVVLRQTLWAKVAVSFIGEEEELIVDAEFDWKPVQVKSHRFHVGFV